MRIYFFGQGKLSPRSSSAPPTLLVAGLRDMIIKKCTVYKTTAPASSWSTLRGFETGPRKDRRRRHWRRNLGGRTPRRS